MGRGAGGVKMSLRFGLRLGLDWRGGGGAGAGWAGGEGGGRWEKGEGR